MRLLLWFIADRVDMIARPNFRKHELLKWGIFFILLAVLGFLYVASANAQINVQTAINRPTTCLLNSAFGPRIPLIHFLCTKEKMGRPDALWNIAAMAYFHPLGNSTVMDYPSQPMGFLISIALDFYGSIGIVAGSVKSTNPQPAIVGRVNLCPKSFSRGIVALGIE